MEKLRMRSGLSTTLGAYRRSQRASGPEEATASSCYACILGGDPRVPPVRAGFSVRPGSISFHLDRRRSAHSGARLGAAKSPMANIRSQIKRNRQNERRRLSNKSVRSEIRTRTKTAVTALDLGAD